MIYTNALGILTFIVVWERKVKSR